MAKIFKDGITQDSATGQIYQVGKSADATDYVAPAVTPQSTLAANAVAGVGATTDANPASTLPSLNLTSPPVVTKDSNGTNMVNLTNKNGQKVSVSKQDWDTNPSYKNGDWTAESSNPSGDALANWIASTMNKNTDIVAQGMQADKDRLQASKVSQTTALDQQYAVDLGTLQKRNKDSGNSLKARLLKLGVSPSDSAWSNAEAGQMDRDAEAESKLRSEYQSNKAKIEAGVDAQITQVAMQENNQAFQAQVTNMQNMLTKAGQGMDLFKIFEKRSADEKDREVQAAGDLMDWNSKMLTLGQNEKQMVAKTMMENATTGMYNIADKNTAKMLSDMESKYPDYLNGILGIATQGLSDRMLSKTQKELEIAHTKAQIAKLRSDASGSGSKDKEKKAFYEDADKQLGLLSSGKTDWATAYNTIVSKYGTPADVIDSLLNKNVWSDTDASGMPKAYVDQSKIKKNNAPMLIGFGNNQ